jgi:hypothetical protein
MYYRINHEYFYGIKKNFGFLTLLFLFFNIILGILKINIIIANILIAESIESFVIKYLQKFFEAKNV